MCNTYSVYCHTNKINGKKYIGITQRKPEKRWGSNGCNYKGQVFYNAIQKYGWDNFEHEILYENLSKTDAENVEIELISKFKTRNEKFGYNVAIGGMLTSEFSVKPIDQYDLDGNYICSWNSIIEAANFHNIDSSIIVDMCKGQTKRSTICKYIFRYKDEPFKKYDTSCTVGGATKIYQFTMDGTFVNEYETMSQAELSVNGALYCNIARAAKNNKLAYGYVWSYDRNFHFKSEDYGCTVSVDKYDLDGKFISTYMSIIDGARSVNKGYEGVTNIKSVCDGQTITAYGYIWRYKGQPFDKYCLTPKTIERAINQYSIDGQFITTYTSAKKVAEILNYKTNTGITNCCRKRIKSSHGFKWYYADDPNQPDKSAILKVDLSSVKISR